VKDYFDSFSSHLKDRFFSPLSFAFLVSWLVWNYKFVLVFFSDMKPYVKFSYISGQVYPDLFTSLFVGLLGPLITSLFYVIVYPFITHLIMGVTNWHARRIEIRRQESENETPMSEESARAFRKEQYERVNKLERSLDDNIELVRGLKGAAIQAESKIIDLMQEKSKADEHCLKLTSALEEARAAIDSHASETDAARKEMVYLNSRENEAADYNISLKKINESLQDKITLLRNSHLAEMSILKNESAALKSNLDMVREGYKKLRLKNKNSHSDRAENPDESRGKDETSAWLFEPNNLAKVMHDRDGGIAPVMGVDYLKYLNFGPAVDARNFKTAGVVPSNYDSMFNVKKYPDAVIPRGMGLKKAEFEKFISNENDSGIDDSRD
jgi:hypothetical protein